MELLGAHLTAPDVKGLLTRALGVRKISDEGIVFLMPVFRDAETARRSLTRLRRFYPTSRVVLISDGDGDFPGEAFVEEFGAEYIAGENLYGMQHRGAMVQRMLAAYLDAPARALVRMDTDARMDRRFRYLPRRDGVFGTVGGRSGTLQGGCIVVSHNAAVRLHASGIFMSDRLLDPAATWGKYSSRENLERKLGQQRIAYDKVLHWGCVETGVATLPFGEIFSVWKAAPEHARRLSNAGLRSAIVHPDKMTGEGGAHARTPS